MHRGIHIRRHGALDETEEVLGKPFDLKVVRRFFSYVNPHRKIASVSLGSMLIYTVTTVAQPWIIKLGIDALVDAPMRGTIGNLPWIVTLFSFNAIINFGSNYVHTISLARVSQELLFSLRTEIFTHLQNLSVRFFDRNEVGRVMSRAQNDVNQLQEFFNMVLVTLADTLALVGIIIALFLMEPKLAALTLSVIPILVGIMVIWQRFAWGTFMEVRRAISTVNGTLQENISGVRVIQALKREPENTEYFKLVNFRHLAINLRATRLSAALMPTVEILTAISIGFVVIVGGLMVMEEGLLVGVVVAFILYIQRFFEPIRTLTMQYTGFQRAMTSGIRIFNLLDTPIEVQESPKPIFLPSTQGRVQIEGVHFHYRPGMEVIRGIDLDIHPGETIALVGATGAGKTTLTSLLARFYDVTSGRILIDGHDIRELSRDSLTKSIAMVLQEPFLFSGTIAENIRYNKINATDAEIVWAAGLVDAHKFIEQLPQGYNTNLEERGRNLSLGERQLLSFARALLADPKILILDEATASIDSNTEATIQLALKEVLSGRTAIIVAHRLSTVRSVDRIVVLLDGQIVEQGSHMELLHIHGVYSDLYNKYFARLEEVNET